MLHKNGLCWHCLYFKNVTLLIAKIMYLCRLNILTVTSLLLSVCLYLNVMQLILKLIKQLID